MARSFPAIKPSARQYTPGTYPTRTYRALAGTTVKRSFGNKPYGHSMALEFRNIPDTTLAQILSHYHDSQGGFSRFALPNAVFAGMDATVRVYMQSPKGIQWEYADPPQVESVYPGISNVSVSLLGELNF